MIKDNVELMDIDEHQREIMVAGIPKGLVKMAKRFNWTIDLATSDVTLYIRDHLGGEIAA